MLSRNIFMIACMIFEFSYVIRFYNKWADVSQKYHICIRYHICPVFTKEVLLKFLRILK